MTHLSPPFLAQFGEAPQDNCALPDLFVDSTTGLLRRENTQRPFIDEVMADTAQRILHQHGPDRPGLKGSHGDIAAAALMTIITRAAPEPSDPDLIRTANPRFAPGLSTVVTKAELGHLDLVQTQSCW